jgi:UDP-3-O-[3-hydroxymyristoyl] glucosamine N-acyltransferase
MPQFGGLIIENNVQIGANTTIARGAIDNTVISKGCKIDNSCFVSHNNFLGENVFMVGAGAMVMKNVGDNKVVMGNPAKEMFFPGMKIIRLRLFPVCHFHMS